MTRGRWLLVATAGMLVGCGDDGPSVVAPVEVRVSGCAASDDIAGGIVVADGHVLTVAHVLRDARAVTVDGRRGEVVALDHRLDAAVIAVATDRRPVALSPEVGPGPATVDGEPVTVRRVVVADVEEPRDDTRYTRGALVIEAETTRGDSGSGVVAPDGTLAGMVFASSTREERVAYAVTAAELAPFVETALTEPAPVPLSCHERAR